MNLKTICASCMQDDSGEPVCPKCGAPFQISVSNPLLLSPRTLLHEQYMIGRTLGHGGFGITYLAWDVGLQTRLAVKEYMPAGVAYRLDKKTVVPLSESNKEDYEWGLDRFLEEARVLKRRNHSNIVSVDTVFRDNGTAYLVMEYLEGMTFEEFLRSRGGTIPFEDALRIMLPAMDALSAVHTDNVLHRDVSPDNIYIAKTGKVKLIDFGAARHALSQKSAKLTVILKAGYTPEEQYRVRGSQGPWTDVYAAAATLYRAITGKIPPGSLDRQAEDTLALPSQLGVAIPAMAERALMKALAVRGIDRYQSIEDLKRDLTAGALVTRPAPVKLHGEKRAAAAGAGYSSQTVSPITRPAEREHQAGDDTSTLETKIKRYETAKPKPAEPAAEVPIAPDSQPQAQPRQRLPLPKGAFPALGAILVLALAGGVALHSWRKPPATPPQPERAAWPAQPADIPQSDLERQRLLDAQGQQDQAAAAEPSAAAEPGMPEPPPAKKPVPSAQQKTPSSERLSEHVSQPPTPRSSVPPTTAATNPEPVVAPPPTPAVSYDDMLKQAQSMAAKQQYSDAQTLLNSAIHANPAGWKANNELAEIELYHLNLPAQAFDHYRAALTNGGHATFRVSFDHGVGWLSVSKGKAAFKDDAGSNSFAMSEVQEAKKNKSGIVKFGKAHNTFHIRLASGENYNFEPTSPNAGHEVDFILAAIEP
jgi:serine/threonine protein kinase